MEVWILQPWAAGVRQISCLPFGMGVSPAINDEHTKEILEIVAGAEALSS